MTVKEPLSTRKSEMAQPSELAVFSLSNSGVVIDATASVVAGKKRKVYQKYEERIKTQSSFLLAENRSTVNILLDKRF